MALTTAASATFSMLFYLGSFVVEWLYRAFMESSPWQATLGKRVMGLVVTDGTGQRIGFFRASVRHWSKLLSQLTFFFGFVMIAAVA